MALGNTVSGECGMRLRSIPSFGRRKRVIVRSSSSCIFAADDSITDFDYESPSKLLRGDDDGGEDVALSTVGDVSLLESLPQDLLIKIVCGVDHEDLKQLFHVSKTIREATITAKTSHFAYRTPSKAVRSMRNSVIGLEISRSQIEVEAPNAPKHKRVWGTRRDKKLLDEIRVALFAEDDEEELLAPRNGLA